MYQPYNKSDKIGKPFDFVSAALMHIPVKPAKTGAAQKENELFDEEEKGFEVVEEEFKKKTKPTTKKPV